MRYNELTQEAERNTRSAKEIEKTLKKAGYKRLGTGADATAWMKDQGTVIKIIMPDLDEDRSAAANIFYKFYEFCQQNSQYENLPKFIDIGGKHHAEFNIGGRDYIQIAMEQLYPIDEYGIEGDIVNIFSDRATKKEQWDGVKRKLFDINYISKDSDNPEKTLQYIKSLDNIGWAKLQILYQLMVILYHTGRINKFGWDLHTGNVMKRKDGTMVITDPWFSYMGSR
jgi:hypothetical protein